MRTSLVVRAQREVPFALIGAILVVSYLDDPPPPAGVGPTIVDVRRAQTTPGTALAEADSPPAVVEVGRDGLGDVVVAEDRSLPWADFVATDHDTTRLVVTQTAAVDPAVMAQLIAWQAAGDRELAWLSPSDSSTPTPNETGDFDD